MVSHLAKAMNIAAVWVLEQISWNRLWNFAVPRRAEPRGWQAQRGGVRGADDSGRKLA
jgi:hypothetical protein